MDPTQALNRGDFFGSPASTKSKILLHGRPPERKVCVNLVKAKDFIKANLVGRSDPYAILKYGNQKFKTKTVKNSLEPLWNHEAYDADKLGKTQLYNFEFPIDLSLPSLSASNTSMITFLQLPSGISNITS